MASIGQSPFTLDQDVTNTNKTSSYREVMDFYCTTKDNIVFVKEEASSSYWDNLWNEEANWIERYTKGISLRGSFVKLFQRYLPKGASVLEAGCGRGQFVYALSHNGYDVLGVDYAEKTVAILNKKLPELKVTLGDVTDLRDIADASYDAYYSGGVIEHFWDGYDSIVSEAHRVLKQGGHLFITFPFMSAARKRIKTSLPQWTESRAPQGFYQYALDPDKVIKAISSKGFQLIHRKSRNGAKGFTDSYPTFPVISSIQKWNNKSLFSRIIKRSTSKLLAIIGFGHTIELVFVKQK